MSLFLSGSQSAFALGSESWPRFLNRSAYHREGRTATAALTHPPPAPCAFFAPRGPCQTPCFALDSPNISGLCSYLSTQLECPPPRCSGDELPRAQLLHPFIVGLNIEWGKTRAQGAWHLALPGTASVIRIIKPWDVRNGEGLVVPTSFFFPSGAMEDLEFGVWYAGKRSGENKVSIWTPFVLLGAHQPFLTCSLIKRQPSG